MKIVATIKHIEDHFDIKPIYRRSFFHSALFGWVTALRLFGMKRKDAIISFQKYFGAEELDRMSLAAQYTQTQKKFVKDFKSDDIKMIVVEENELKEMIKSAINENEIQKSA